MGRVQAVVGVDPVVEAGEVFDVVHWWCWVLGYAENFPSDEVSEVPRVARNDKWDLIFKDYPYLPGMKLLSRHLWVRRFKEFFDVLVVVVEGAAHARVAQGTVNA